MAFKKIAEGPKDRRVDLRKKGYLPDDICDLMVISRAAV